MFDLRAVPIASVLAAAAAVSAFPYEYDTSDPTQGAGPEAPWRVEAQWDAVDETATREIHRHTTEPRYLTPMVSYIPEHPDVPSPRDLLGYIAGTEGRLTRPVDEIRYFETLAAATPRVLIQEMGPTEEGRTMHLVIVSSAENLQRLDTFKDYTRRLADPRQIDAAEAREIVGQAKPIMHITAGLHSPETGPPEMVMELAYRLAVSEHPEIRTIRDNVILLITPITDVDGRAKVVDWYYRHQQQYTSREYMPGGPPYWGKYTFHDNNRDGIQMSQMLTQNYMKTFMEWHPVYSLDLHESVPLLYVSGGTGPYNPNIDPITIREWQLLAHYELAELQKHNLPGVWTWGFYTGWNPSYLLWITNNHNSMGRFYETFGNSSARTMERDLSDASYAGTPITEAMWYRADPPDKKVQWSLRNNTNYMQSGVLASLKFLSQNGVMLLENFYRKGVNAIENGRNEAPYAWVIPTDQRDPSRVAYLVNQLRRHGVEVHRTTQDFEVKEGEFNSGDYIVRLDQPYGPLAKNLLEKQEFPRDAEHRPYDDVAWTLGLHYRVDTNQIDDKSILQMQHLEPVIDVVNAPGAVIGDGDPAAYAVRNTGQNTLITARYMLDRYDVLAVEETFEAGGVEFPAGSWVIPHKRGLKGRIEQAALRTGLTFHPLERQPDVPSHELDLPRVALYHNWVRTQDDGWVRFSFEQAGVPFEYIADEEIRRGNLHRRYDVILMANQGGFGSLTAMVHGRDPKFGKLDYRRSGDVPSFGFIDDSEDVSGGIGFGGLANLEEFLDRGGTLLLMGSSGRLAVDAGLIRNVSTSTGGGVSTPGTFLQTKLVRPEHPVVYGYEEVNHVFRVNGPVYRVPERFDHWIVMKYGTKPLRDDDETEDEEEESAEESDESATESEETVEDATEKSEKKKHGPFMLSGYVDGQSTLEESGAIIDVPRLQGGRVILYSFNPMHRHLNHGDHNFVYNAILHWNDFPEPQPKDDPRLAKD